MSIDEGDLWWQIEGGVCRARCTGPIDEFIGAQIKRVREERRLEVKDLGKMLGISGQQVRKYELGQNRVPAATLVVISKMLDHPIGLFLPSRRPLGGFSHAEAEQIIDNLLEISDERFRTSLVALISAAASYSRTPPSRLTMR